MCAQVSEGRDKCETRSDFYVTCILQLTRMQIKTSVYNRQTVVKSCKASMGEGIAGTAFLEIGEKKLDPFVRSLGMFSTKFKNRNFFRISVFSDKR